MGVNLLAFGPAGYSPDTKWQPLSHLIETPSNKRIFVINVGGIVFYQDVEFLEWQLISVPAIVAATQLLPYLKFHNGLLLRPAMARINSMARSAHSADTARLQQQLAIADLLAVFGGVGAFIP